MFLKIVKKCFYFTAFQFFMTISSLKFFFLVGGKALHAIMGSESFISPRNTYINFLGTMYKSFKISLWLSQPV